MALVETEPLTEDSVCDYELMLLDLYRYGLLLPWCDADDQSFHQEMLQSNRKYIEDHKRKIEKGFDSSILHYEVPVEYCQKFNPFDSNSDDYFYINIDLMEIYEDIKEGVQMYENNLVNEALWHWGFGCEYHWGIHLVSALKPLHWIYNGNYEEKPEGRKG